jgi:hypothetical protein
MTGASSDWSRASAKVVKNAPAISNPVIPEANRLYGFISITPSGFQNSWSWCAAQITPTIKRIIAAAIIAGQRIPVDRVITFMALIELRGIF